MLAHCDIEAKGLINVKRQLLPIWYERCKSYGIRQLLDIRDKSAVAVRPIGYDNR